MLCLRALQGATGIRAGRLQLDLGPHCRHPAACIQLPASCKAPELPRHTGAFPGSLLPRATAPAAFSYGQPNVDLELFNASLFPPVCQSFLDCCAKNVEPD